MKDIWPVRKYSWESDQRGNPVETPDPGVSTTNLGVSATLPNATRWVVALQPTNHHLEKELWVRDLSRTFNHLPIPPPKKKGHVHLGVFKRMTSFR